MWCFPSPSSWKGTLVSDGRVCVWDLGSLSSPGSMIRLGNYQPQIRESGKWVMYLLSSRSISNIWAWQVSYVFVLISRINDKGWETNNLKYMSLANKLCICFIISKINDKGWVIISSPGSMIKGWATNNLIIHESGKQVMYLLSSPGSMIRPGN